MITLRNISIVLLVMCELAVHTAIAPACPFCSPETRTLSEELADSDVAILATLVEPPADSKKPAIDPETGEASFAIEKAYLGDAVVEGLKQVKTVFFGEPIKDDKYFIRGVGEPPEWSLPIALSPTAEKYLVHIQTLPKSGADRLAFFQEYLEHPEPLLAQDSYDEFARAPYQDLIDLKPQINHAKVLQLLTNPQTSPSRRRLFFTMLGVCKDSSDVPLLEEMLLSDVRHVQPAARVLTAANVLVGGPLAGTLLDESLTIADRQEKLGLDAMVACYLTLVGDAGLDKIDARFLKNRSADYSHVYSVLQAIRFLAEEETVEIPRKRILKSARLLLDSPDFADQVIPDLARWEDWSVLGRLIEMYVRTDELGFQKFVREPIVTYLDVAAEQGGELAERAQAGLEQAEAIDSAAFKRARSLSAFGLLRKARPDSKTAQETSTDSEPTSTEESGKGSMGNFSNGGAPPDPSKLGGADQASWELKLEPPDEPLTPATEPPDSVKPITPASAVAPVVNYRVPSQSVVPSQSLRIGVPLGAAAIFCGLFWLILRGPGG